MNRIESIRRCAVFCLILMFIGVTYTNSSAQNFEDRRLSINLNTGVTFALDIEGILGPMAGNFNVASARRALFGGSIQYAINPVWAIDASIFGGEFENQSLNDPFFHNDFLAFSFSGVANLNNLLNLNWRPARYVNPHLSIGLGMLNSSIVAEDLDTRSLSLMLTGGAGFSVYLTRWADFFVNYDYYIVGDDLLDGVSGPGGSDQFAALGGGIRLNFGSGQSQLASWATTREPRLPDPVALRDERQETEPEAEPETVQEPERETAPEPEREMTTEAEEMLTGLTSETKDWLTGLAIFNRSPIMNRPAGLDEAKASASERVEQRREAERIAAERREAERRAAERRAAEQPEGAYTEAPADGHYLQISSVQNTDLARQMQSDLIDALEGVISNPQDRAVIHRFEGFYRIMVGPFAQSAQARNVHGDISDKYPDAFVIRYPRW